MRRKIAAGNWKMNLDIDGAKTLLSSIAETDIPSDVEVILAVPACYLSVAKELSESQEKLHISAQNAHQKISGAYTGEISFSMIQSMQVPYCLIGHSERRQYNHDTDEIIQLKVDAALSHGVRPILCCGEPLEVRENGEAKSYVLNQLEKNLFHLTAEQLAEVVIAYEPIWAIGTGVTASPAQAQEMHAFIRESLNEKYGQSVSDNMPILYGGSVKPNNAEELFANKDVDGGLVGGASLKADTFIPIINAFS